MVAVLLNTRLQTQLRRAADLPEDDSEHDRYLSYYDEIGIDEDFYWFTLDAAPAESIHWMTPTEIDRYGIATSMF